MEFLQNIYTELLYRPVYNLVLFTYLTLPIRDMGLTIIYLAVLIRVLLLPVSLTGSGSSRRMESIKPQLEKLSRMPEAGRRKDQTRKLLKQNRINVYATAFVLVVQVIFLALLYQVFQPGFEQNADQLAYFPVNESVSTSFFGFFDLTHRNWILALITSVLLYAMLSLTTPEPEPGSKLSDVWYVVVLPIVVFVILLLLPASKSLFLLVSILFSIGLYVVAKYIFKVEPPTQSDPE